MKEKRKRQEIKRKANEEMEYYVEGSAVRKLEPVVPRKDTGGREAEVSKTNRMIRKNRERALSMNLPYLVMLSVAMVAVLVLCAN